MISGSYMDLSSKGTLTLDTSANNSNILLKTGSGNINVSTGTLTMTGLLDIRDSTGTLALATDANGNVGVGTTSPLALLHVQGQCVTGDTLLSIRRRRRRKKSGQPDDEDDYDYLTIPIKDVIPGDEVLSLDELEHRFVYSRVNKLMDMGRQSVFEIATEDGRRIQTTAEHPYLTKTNFGGSMMPQWLEVIELSRAMKSR